MAEKGEWRKLISVGVNKVEVVSFPKNNNNILAPGERTGSLSGKEDTCRSGRCIAFVCSFSKCPINVSQSAFSFS